MYDGIDIVIDAITPCLIERSTGEKHATTIEQVHPEKNEYKGWRFDWTIPEKKGSAVYALRMADDPTGEVQGLIAFHPDMKNKFLFGDLMESNPTNVGHDGVYIGVGAHLTAFACKTAKDLGLDTYFFIAKTELIEHYKKSLGARQIGCTQRMYIDGSAFARLVAAYYLEVRNGH
jgi:hypothetical protein